MAFPGELAVARRRRYSFVAAALVVDLWGSAASAQNALHPIPAAECQSFASQIQGAVGFAMKAGEDDFTDLANGAEGRSCHITGTAANQTIANPGELVAKIAGAFGGWRDDTSRDADGADGSTRGYLNGNRIAELDVSWEPGPGASCSDKQPLYSCNIQPQQKLWNVVVDIVEK
jgi:hypothetical protein